MDKKKNTGNNDSDSANSGNSDGNASQSQDKPDTTIVPPKFDTIKKSQDNDFSKEIENNINE